MGNIQVVNVGKTVNFSLDGRLRQKVCKTIEDAVELTKLIFKAKEDGTEESLNVVLAHLNEVTRIAMKCGLERDPNTDKVYMEGFNTPVPRTLVKVMEEYYDNGYPMESIRNFWKLLMINPDIKVRESLFGFINTHDFVITDMGYMVVYKSVFMKEDCSLQNELRKYVPKMVLKVKTLWTTSPRKYMVYRDLNTLKLHITKAVTIAKWDLESKNIEILGNLKEMDLDIEKYVNAMPEVDGKIYTDKHTKKMNIRLGEAVYMERNKCDNNPNKGCSYGLHVGATSYVNKYYRTDRDTIMVCYVNPAHVVAVPTHDNSKMRVSEYFPYSLAELDDNREIVLTGVPYEESDYSHYEIGELDSMVDKIRNKELPIDVNPNQIDAVESRTMEELLTIIKDRLVMIK